MTQAFAHLALRGALAPYQFIHDARFADPGGGRDGGRGAKGERSEAMAPLNGSRLREAARQLCAKDKDLRRLLEVHGPPPLWARRPGFRTLIRIILEQQVSLASAQATFRRLLEGVAPFTPERVAELGADHLRSLGVTRQKAGYCAGVAEAVHDESLDLGAVTRMDDGAAASTLRRLKGIGPWTAEIYLLMALRRPDVWPSGDVALIQAVRAVKRLRRRPSEVRAAEIAQAWRPFRSVAARMLWQHYLAVLTPSRGA